MSEKLPAQIQRFILTSIDSVPHLEAILLLRNPAIEWTTAHIAERLFISDKRAAEILSELCTAGFASQRDGDIFYYNPTSPGLREVLDEIDTLYPRHLVEVSRLIHGKTDKQAQTFGDAFKWRKE